MKITVLSYSMTGNNDALATSVAQALQAEHIKVEEPKTRTTGTIIKDMLFNATPKVQPAPACVDDCDMVLLLGPIWMGSVAAPLRAYLKHLRKNPRPYAFFSISGGALGPNPKLANELTKKTGEQPAALVDLHIADLLPADPKPTREETSRYKISDTDISKLTDTIVKAVKETIQGEYHEKEI